MDRPGVGLTPGHPAPRVLQPVRADLWGRSIHSTTTRLHLNFDVVAAGGVHLR